MTATARTATAGERTMPWPLVIGVYLRYDQYQLKTIREIPLVILTPVEDSRTQGNTLLEEVF